MTRMRRLTIMATALLLPLAACHKTPEPSPEPENNVVEEAPAPPAPETNMVEEIPAPPKVKEPVVKLPEPPPPSADQQVLDDADATGMTAHVSRDGEGGNEQ